MSIQTTASRAPIATKLEMKEGPIGSNGPLVRALLESRKTQAWRMVQPSGARDAIDASLRDGSWVRA